MSQPEPSPHEPQIQALLRYLPPHQRTRGEAMVRRALSLGWHSVGLWEWLPNSPCDVADLVGVMPSAGGPGRFAFLTLEIDEDDPTYEHANA